MQYTIWIPQLCYNLDQSLTQYHALLDKVDFVELEGGIIFCTSTLTTFIEAHS
jgi:hypothetical protein